MAKVPLLGSVDVILTLVHMGAEMFLAPTNSPREGTSLWNRSIEGQQDFAWEGMGLLKVSFSS
jgi:hypothetical protein